MHGVNRVPGSGVIHVVTRIGIDEPVVRLIIYAAKTQRWPQVIALGGVIENDVEDDFDACGVQVSPSS